MNRLKATVLICCFIGIQATEKKTRRNIHKRKQNT